MTRRSDGYSFASIAGWAAATPTPTPIKPPRSGPLGAPCGRDEWIPIADGKDRIRGRVGWVLARGLVLATAVDHWRVRSPVNSATFAFAALIASSLSASGLAWASAKMRLTSQKSSRSSMAW